MRKFKTGDKAMWHGQYNGGGQSTLVTQEHPVVLTVVSYDPEDRRYECEEDGNTWWLYARELHRIEITP